VTGSRVATLELLREIEKTEAKMLANRVHYQGGAPASHRAVNSGDPAAIAALLASLGLLQPHNQQGRQQRPWGHRVGVVDMLNLPNSDGQPSKVEWLPLSASAGNDIAAAATRDYELKPTKYARPGPLVMDSTIASNLVMTNLQVGGKPVFAGTGAVPCVLFSHLSIHNALSSYVANNNAPITFTLTNIHASVTQTVRGVWICETSELLVG
jgi:hypothetical protein